MSEKIEITQRPSFPYVAYLATRNPGKPTEYKDVFFFNLESSSGTFENVQKYEMKGWPIIEYGNLLQPSAIGGVTTAENIVDEHTKIRKHIDNQLVMRSMARAELQKEIASERAGSLEEKIARDGAARGKKAGGVVHGE